ncbi:hypothetical protein TWF694_002188 [Orbilia ellipsospora]|uniref:Uncharacterized protein n=1 Tax=Orbilia ellipsospora TaxID=2528407 RepID=A0AAV9X4T6_9PEZI
MAKRKRKVQPVIQQDTSQQDGCPPQVRPKLWQRFYEPLILLRAYGKSQGTHIKEVYSESGHKTIKKKFLDALAYSCDYLPGGDTVTAVAIQDGPNLAYWVASNTNQAVKLKPYLSGTLDLLSKAHNISKDGSDTLKKWLVSLNDSTLDLAGLCRVCYESRDSESLKMVRQRAGENSIHESDSSNGALYARIRHFVGRLGSHMKAAQVLVETGIVCPRLFLDYSIQIENNHPSFVPPGYRNKSSINEIIKRMIEDPQKCEYYQKFLHSQDDLFSLQLQDKIKDEYKNPKFKLRIHAEVILLDLFHRKHFDFLDMVSYIGVSKPSCFLCHRYFQAHPLKVETSGCSNNLYLKWQPPYVPENSSDSVKEQERILISMSKEVRTFVLDNIKPGYRGIAAHPDSTTGFDTMSYTDRTENPNRRLEHRDQLVPEEQSGLADLIYDPETSEEDFEYGGVPLSLPVSNKAIEAESLAKDHIVDISDEHSGDSENGGISLYA